jgi:hypothetical protein
MSFPSSSSWVIGFADLLPRIRRGVAAVTGGFCKLSLVRLDQLAEQLPRFGFELTDEGEVSFGVPV